MHPVCVCIRIIIVLGYGTEQLGVVLEKKRVHAIVVLMGGLRTVCM